MSLEKMNDNRILQEGVKNFGTRNQAMRLNRLATLLNITEVNDMDPNTWVSSTNGPQRVGKSGEADVSIGGKPLPETVAEKWDWSTEGNEQLLLKIAHEFAHKFQHDKGYESALVRSLESGKISDDDEEFTAYITLYLTLENTGSVTGLGADPFYKEQSSITGKLKMEVLEDMTELIGAYLISDDYLFSKLNKSVNTINQAQAEQIAILIARICKELD